MQKRKQARFAEEPQPEKRAKWQDDPLIEGVGPLSWRFSVCDRDGPYSWSLLSPEDRTRVLDRMAELESMTWSEITKTGSHPIELGRLCKAAQSRLTAIGQDDADALVSFRITGAGRMWCIQDASIMRVLWWDPHHQVYPVKKDRADRVKQRRRR